MKNNYSFFNISYGILGVGIGIPNESITVTNVEYIHIGELIKTNNSRKIWQIEEEYREAERNRKIREESLSFLQKVSLYVKDMTALIPEYIRVIEETIKEAKWRKNYAIRLTLKLKHTREEKEFMVYNYHMPCTFKTPIIQFLHLSVFKRLILQHHMIPTILAGDFNITPSSDEYKFFTGATPIPESKTVYLPKEDQEDISYQAFKMTSNQTAQFTCHSHTKFGGYFKDTLDYIFVSNANIRLSGPLLETDEKMPNSICPSDHFPIYADIDFYR
jgi:endonuclease/exonuclease/phosphatase family metal-dependent hydrolase